MLSLMGRVDLPMLLHRSEEDILKSKKLARLGISVALGCLPVAPGRTNKYSLDASKIYISFVNPAERTCHQDSGAKAS